MYFQEQRVDTDCCCRSRHMRYILALAAGGSTLAARDLYAVRGIHDYGVTEVAHDRQGAHIGDKRVVTEAGTALSQHDAVAACFFGFGNNVLHIPRCEELAFFYINNFAGLRGLIN